MAVSAEELERRRRLADASAQAVDPTEIEGLAPPPTPSVRAAQQPDRVETQQPEFVPVTPGQVTELPPSAVGQLAPPPVQESARPAGTAKERLAELRSRPDINQRLGEIRQDRSNREAGRLETAASEFGEGFTGIFKTVPEAAIRGVIAERQGQGISSRLGLQGVANAVLGRELTEDELTRVMPEIENNAATQAIDKALDFGLGSNPEFMAAPEEEDFELAGFLNSTVPNALGSAGGFLAAALVGNAVAGPAGGVATAAALGAMATGVEQAKDVESKGGTNAQIIDAFVAGNVPGLLEAAPLARALKRLDRGSGGHMTRIAKEGFKGSIEEWLQESIQAASTNAITNAILDLKDPIIDRSVAEGGAAGAIAGFIQSALLTAVGGRRGGRRKGPAENSQDAAEGNAPGEGQPAPSPAPAGATQELTPEQEGDQDATELFGEEEQQFDEDAAFDELADQDLADAGVVEPPLPADEAAEIPRLEGESDTDYLQRRQAILNQREADRLAAEGQPAADQAIPETPSEAAGEPQPAVAPPAEPAPAEPAAVEPAPPAVEPTPEPPAPVEPEPVAPPVEPTTGVVPAGARAVAPTGAQEGGTNRIRTPSGRQEVDTQFIVADLDQLVTSDNEAFPAALQPREREGRQALQQQVDDIVANPDPGQLGVAGTTDTGAPLVNDRGEVISGNGRIAALRRMRQENPEGFARIQGHMAERLGVELGPNEVLAQAILTPMDSQQQADFALDSNTRTGADLSEAEQAKADAPLLTTEMLANFAGGELDSNANAAFVRDFRQAIPPNERNNFQQSGGQISSRGKARLRGALLARALGANTEAGQAAVTRTLEDPGDNTKNVTNAVVDASPSLIQLQQAVEAGTVPESFANLAEDLAQAVNLMSSARRRGMSVNDALDQQDLTEKVSPVAEELVRSFMKPNFSAAASRKDVADTLTRFAEESLRTTNEAQPDLVGGQPAVPDPAAILAAARASVQGAQSQGPAQPTPGGQLFGASGQPTQEATGGQDGQQPTAEPTPDTAPVAPGEQQPGPGGEPAAAGDAGATAGEPAATPAENVSPQQPEPASPGAEGQGSGVNEVTDFESAERVFGQILGREITGTGPAVLQANRRFDEIMAETGPQGQTSNVRPDVAALEAMADAELITDAELATLMPLVMPETTAPAVTPHPPDPDAPTTQEPGKAIPPDPVTPVADQMDTENQTKQSYDEAPSATEAARRLGNSALEESAKEAEKNAALPENHPDINTIAIQFNKDLIQENTTTIIGKVINTVRDIAGAVQQFRDPRFETMRYFFLDANDTVIFQTGVSSRLPGSSAVAPTGPPEWLQQLSINMRDAGAKKVWLMHNHPQHDSTPSTADKGATKWLKDNYFGAAGMEVQHVVVDHNEYSVINKRGIVHKEIKDESLESIDFRTPPEGKNHELLGEKIRTGKDLVGLSQRIMQPNKVTVIGVSGKNVINGIADFNVSLLSTKKIRDQLNDWRNHTGASRIYLAGLPAGTFPIGQTGSGKSGHFIKKDLSPTLNKLMENLVRNRLVTDFLDVDGNSAVKNKVIKFVKSRQDDPLGATAIQVQARHDSDADGLDSHATRRQGEVNQNTKKGQPLERLFRWMFTGFGVFQDKWLVTNEQGEDPQWARGVKMWEGFTDFIVDAKFEETNPAKSWFNGVLHKARFGLLDRHGVPPEARSLDEQRRTFQVELAQQGAEFVTRLEEAGVTTTEEAALVQRFLVGEISEEQISDNEWASVAVEVQAAVDALGMHAVQLGFVSRESYERNKGTWLHRTYFKNEGYFVADNNAINKWLGQNIKGKAQQIGGDTFQGRGLFLEHPQSRILRDVPQEFRDRFTTRTDGKPDPNMQDQRFRIIDLIDQGFGDQQNIPGVAESGRGVKIKRRLFLPADQEVSPNLGAYEDRGEFVVRRVRNNGNLVLWRDYSVAEREHMGEIVDARYNIMRSFQLLGRDLANGDFFLEMASNPEWVWDTDVGGPTPPPATIAEHPDRVRSYMDSEWVLVPDTKIARSNNVSRWGALGGKYVKAEIWNDINQLAEMRTPGKWDEILTTWKLNKTALNPVVHVNNVMSNMVLMDMIDVRTRDLVEGTMMRLAPAILNTPKLKQFHGLARKYANDELLQQMRAYGAFGHSMVDIDLSNEILTPLVRELQQVIDGGKGVENTLVSKGRLMWTISKFWTQVDNALTAQKGMYRLEDEVFRAATVIRKLEQGYTMQDAAVMAREQFLNYDIRAPWINNMRRSVFPFISYTYRAVPALAEAIARRPWKLAKYITMAEIANALAYAISDGEEEYERGSLRTQAQGTLSLGLFDTGWLPGGGIPRMMRLPTNDEFGRAQFLDVRRWVPAGDVFDLHSANPMPVPTWLQFSGPLMIAAELYMNKSAFTGQQIVDPLSDDWADKTKKWGSFAYQAFMPSAPWVPESWYWNRIGETFSGTTDPMGRTNSFTQASLQAFGLKVSSQDPALGYSYKAIEFDNTQRAYKARMNKAARDFNRGLLTEADFKAEQAKVQAKLEQLAANREETFQPFLNRSGDADPNILE